MMIRSLPILFGAVSSILIGATQFSGSVAAQAQSSSALNSSENKKNDFDASNSEAGAIASASNLSTAFKRVARIITPSVVNISTFEKQKPALNGPSQQLPSDPFFEQFKEFFGEDLFERFRRGPQGAPQQGLGTGVIFDTQGHVLTTIT